MIGNVKRTPRPSYRVCPVGINGDIHPSEKGPYRSLDKAQAAALELHAGRKDTWYDKTYRDHFIVVETRNQIHYSTADAPSS